MPVAAPAMNTRFTAPIPQTTFSEPRSDAASLRVTGIPAQLTSFVGREKEIDTIRRLLASTRLLSLTGSGGSGKTRLAVEIVSRESAVGRHAGIWVDLSPVRDASLVAEAAVFERLIRQEELHEDAYRSLMICRARAGDRTAAMREYRRLESMVRKELESEPSKETSALFKKLQRGEAI